VDGMKKYKFPHEVRVTMRIVVNASSDENALKKAREIGDVLAWGGTMDDATYEIIHPESPPPAIVWQGKCTHPGCYESLELASGEKVTDKGWTLEHDYPYCPQHSGPDWAELRERWWREPIFGFGVNDEIL
jgi:hypothetical protein